MLKSLLAKVLWLLPFVTHSTLAEPIVWKIYDDNREFYVLGSIHVGKENLFPLPQAFLEQWNKTNALVVESNILNQPQIVPTINEPFTQQMLTPEQLEKLKDISQSLNLSYPLLIAQPPWLVAITLQATLAAKLELKPDYGIDYVLLQRGEKQGIPIKELESIKQQFEMLEGLPENGTGMLTETIEDWSKTEDSLQCLVEIWKQGDNKQLEELFENQLYDTVTDNALIFSRNKNWAEILTNSDDYKQGHFMIVVGAFHLLGSQGLPNMMKKNGFNVEKLTKGRAAKCQI